MFWAALSLSSISNSLFEAGSHDPIDIISLKKEISSSNNLCVQISVRVGCNPINPEEFRFFTAFSLELKSL